MTSSASWPTPTPSEDSMACTSQTASEAAVSEMLRRVCNSGLHHKSTVSAQSKSHHPHTRTDLRRMGFRHRSVSERREASLMAECRSPPASEVGSAHTVAGPCARSRSSASVSTAQPASDRHVQLCATTLSAGEASGSANTASTHLKRNAQSHFRPLQRKRCDFGWFTDCNKSNAAI